MRVFENAHEQPTVLRISPKGLVDELEMCTSEDLQVLAEANPQGLGKGEDLISYVIDRPGHDRRYAIDSSYLQGKLGWRPVHTFETGIRQTIGWYKNNTEWAFKVTAGIAD